MFTFLRPLSIQTYLLGNIYASLSYEVFKSFIHLTIRAMFVNSRLLKTNGSG